MGREPRVDFVKGGWRRSDREARGQVVATWEVPLVIGQGQAATIHSQAVVGIYGTISTCLLKDRGVDSRVDPMLLLGLIESKITFIFPDRVK